MGLDDPIDAGHISQCDPHVTPSQQRSMLTENTGQGSVPMYI